MHAPTPDAESAPAPPRAGGPPHSTSRFLARALVNQWPRMILPLVVGTAAAVGAAVWLGKQTWEVSGTMLYSPPPVPESQKGLYTPPDLKTLLTLAKSPDLLTGLRDEFDLPVPVTLLDKQFKVTAPPGTQTVTVAFTWGEGDKAAAMTNRLMERFAEQTRDHRRRKMDGYLDDHAARLKDCGARHAAAVAGLQRFYRDHNVVDLAGEAEAARKEIEALQTIRSNALREEVGVMAQRDRVAAEVAEIRRKDTVEAAAAKKYEASLAAASDSRRRQDRLRVLIEEEQKRQGLQAELTARRKAHERMTVLRERGAASQADVDAAAKEVELLNARLIDSDKVKEWKAEMAKIDEAVFTKEPGTVPGTSAIQQTLFRQFEFDLRLIGLRRDLHQAEEGLAAQRRRQGEVQAAVRESEGLQKEIEATDGERQKLVEQAALFRRLRDQQASEFAVVTPARPGPHPAGSNKRLIVLAGLLLAGLAAAGRAGLAEYRATYHGGRRAARIAQVPDLGEVGPDDTAGHRLAVSRLREWRPDYGAVVLFVGDGAADPLPWAVRFGRRLAARDERVLIVDARVGELAPPGAAPTPGLGNYLRYEADDVTGLLAPDDVAGLDVLPAGVAPSLDVLATHRMAEFVQQARGRYSVVALIGPDLARADGVDVLARYADGILTVLSPAAPAGATATLLVPHAARPGDRVRGLIVAREGAGHTTPATTPLLPALPPRLVAHDPPMLGG